MNEDLEKLCEIGGRRRLAGIMSPGDDGLAVIIASNRFDKKFKIVGEHDLNTGNLLGASKGLTSVIEAWGEYAKTHQGENIDDTETSRILRGAMIMYLSIIRDVANEHLSPGKD